MFKHAVTMRFLSILLSLSMVLSTIGNGTAGFDCVANVTDAQGHGASETTSYNGAGHVKNLVNRDAAGNVISEYAYTYYVSGSPATKTDASGTTTYTYDGQNRLKTATYSDGTKDVYTFDDNGNRLTKTFTDAEGVVSVTSYEYDKANRLTKSTEGKAATVYTYDKAGNLLTKTTGEKTVSHSYDLLGRLISYTDGETVASYDYYTSNMRRSKTVNGEKTTHIWIGNDIAVDMGANSASYLKGVRLVWSDYGYYLYNSHGDVVQLLDDNAAVIKTYDYDAFGIQKGEEPTAPDRNPYRYSGEYTDRESGYNYLRARYYDPTIGRFITADNHWNVGNMLYGDDPIRFGGIYVPLIAAMIQSGNLYVYCMNNPLLYIDSDGMFSLFNAIKVAVTATILVAAAVVITTATAGTSCVLLGAAYGAISGAATGAVGGALVGGATAAISHRIQTGSWEGAGKAALNGAAQGAIDGAFTGAITGAITGGMSEAFCFVAGTSVLTAAGYVAIENINTGDLVYAWNEESGETSLKPVVETYLNETDELVHVFVGGEEIISTPSHPFYVAEKGWTQAVQLRAGDILVLWDGGYVIIEMIEHELLENPIKVYNFQVADDHTYFVGDNGVLVHNACGQTGSYEIQFESGKNYVGKGSEARMRVSARTHSTLHNDKVVSMDWTSASSTKEAFVQEYIRMAERGVNNLNTYNKIWSPGRKIYIEAAEALFK